MYMAARSAGDRPSRVAPSLIRLLTFSTLFPNPSQPNHGIFVETRLRHLVACGEAESTVLAPVPWFPGRTPPRGVVPPLARRGGLVVRHPRFLAMPGLGMFSNPFTLYRTARAAVARMATEGVAIDVIDAHYLYPDGVAAVWLGRALGRPVVLTARGSDVSELPQYWYPRRLIREAVARADALIAVSAGLKQKLLALGAAECRTTVLRNGVDLEAFQPPGDRTALRRSLGLGDAPMLLAVGRLVPLKAYDRVISALPDLPGYTLLIAGEGPERGALEALAKRLDLIDRVRFLGAVPHGELAGFYGAADALVLASTREGWPNVVLEAMACGTPVVATPVFGVTEMIAAPEAGLVIRDGTAEALAEGVRRLVAAPPDRGATRKIAEQFSWDATTAGQIALFRRVLARA